MGSMQLDAVEAGLGHVRRRARECFDDAFDLLELRAPEASTGSRGERTADGPTGAYQLGAPSVSRPRCTSCCTATAPPAWIALARARRSGITSGRYASSTLPAR